MGDNILASLSAFHACRMAKTEERPNESAPDGDCPVHVPSMDEVTVEIIAEVEDDGGVEQPEETTADVDDGKKEKEMNEKPQSDLTGAHQASVRPPVSSGPHDCPDCDRKFKFASSLTAHRVVHTGERPHRCPECGRCFSFRQALRRHLETHVGSAGDAAPDPAEVPENAAVDSPVNVRTSRRKRKPTMKIQVINLQKRMSSKREVTRERPPTSLSWSVSFCFSLIIMMGAGRPVIMHARMP